MKGAAAFLPYLASAFVPALGPARALALGWILEAARPPAAPGTRRADWLLFAIGHGCAWGLLHLLRADAPCWRGLVLLALAASSWPAWRRPGRLGPVVPLALLAPALLVFLLALGGLDPAAARTLDPWQALDPVAAAAAAAGTAPLPELPPGASWSGLPLVPPPRLVPHALADSPWRPRALSLVGLLLVWRLAAALRPRWRIFLLPLGPVLVAGGAWVAAPPAGLHLRWASAEPAAAVHVLELRQGDGVWDPLAGSLLPPSSTFRLVPRADGRVDVQAEGCWAVVQAAAGLTPSPATAWLELHPLRAPRGGGPAVPAGALGLLRWWAAADRSGEPARWELGQDGALSRRSL